ncbi:MAG: 4-alpha-glucanotransferase [Paracoccaceae bacterium]
MNATIALNNLAEKFGILPQYRDLSRNTQIAGPDTLKAMLRANGLVLDNDRMVVEALADIQAKKDRRFCPVDVIVETGQPLALEFGAGAEWHLTIEDKHVVGLSGRGKEQIILPALKSGLHQLRVEKHGGSQTVNLIVAPPRLPMLEEVTGKSRIWGVNLALYGLNSERNCDLGDYHDLAVVLDGLAANGADFLGINPVHALGWNTGGTISPYSPSHRGFLSTSHIALDQIAGFSNTQNVADILSAAGYQKSTAGKTDLIDYGNHQKRHHIALEKLYALFVSDADTAQAAKFDDYCKQSGEPLVQYALFEAISEEHGANWRNWPDGFKFKNAGVLSAAKQRLAARMRFHCWQQWVAQLQLRLAQQSAKNSGMALGLYLDLAVGSRRGGAESWCESSAIAQGVSLGAPPDHLNPAGQNWTLAAYAPRKLAARQYGPWRQAIAAAMRNCGVLRIDHVLGLNRSFWIPDDGSPGAYIRQQFKAFLALISIEAERANTVVIGEDLGLVPKGFRDTIRDRGFYGYSVLLYEKTDAGTFKGYAKLRPQSLACFGTHDTPSMKGFETGGDVDWWQELGWIDVQSAQDKRRNRGAEVEELTLTGLAVASGSISDVIHAGLAASPAAMVSVQIDDVFGVAEAQNLPGTIDEHPNWRRRCPVAPKDFGADSRLLKISRLMAQGGRSNDHSSPEELRNEG